MPKECHCQSTNSELMQLLLQSPLLPVVEERAKEALRCGLAGQGKRVDLIVLDRLLDDVLSGKYVMQRELVQFDKVALKTCEKYMNGLNITALKVTADEISGAKPYQPSSPLFKKDSPKFVQSSEEWFNLDGIAKQEKWLEEILTRRKDDMILEQDEFMTFLTQQWKQKDQAELAKMLNDPKRTLAESNFKLWVDNRTVWRDMEKWTQDLDPSKMEIVS